VTVWEVAVAGRLCLPLWRPEALLGPPLASYAARKSAVAAAFMVGLP